MPDPTDCRMTRRKLALATTGFLLLLTLPALIIVMPWSHAQDGEDIIDIEIGVPVSGQIETLDDVRYCQVQVTGGEPLFMQLDGEKTGLGSDRHARCRRAWLGSC